MLLHGGGGDALFLGVCCWFLDCFDASLAIRMFLARARDSRIAAFGVEHSEGELSRILGAGQ